MSGLLKTISQNVGAGSSTRYHVTARHFRLLEGNGLVVRFFSNGAEEGIADGVDSGFYLKADDLFDEIRIESADAQTIKFTAGSGEAGAASAVSISGTVSTKRAQVVLSQAAVAVTNASGVLLAANVNRRFLLVQNNDAAGNVFLNLTGAAATAAAGVKIAPGGSLLLSDGEAGGAAVNAIGDIANNPNVVVVEG